ncbi:glycosyltransferase [Flavobacteriaceae bacterium XHP0103]|uniref:glycosyltransferase family 2 protein n=1 Tax=Marixanthotalea marina TaxID=2844359 RepID=UPI002989FEC8|nr:glycosyltransferase [Marixanthotalea marina]MBU3822745.1 glycosyltransferase [Marixanthotalea marina]
MNLNPLVSVCVQTYQHVNYIKQCLDGILMQQTTFPFEIILGEDESSDGTRAICIDYANKYPDKIRLFLRSRKDVIYINGNPTGRYNLIENLKACRGKYIAMCEGDDYWTDPLKLQKQVDFLEANPDYAICFHKVQLLTEGVLSEANDVTISRYNKIKVFPVTLNDLLQQGNFIHTPSVMFRNQVFDFPFEYWYSPIGDYFLYVILANKGYIKRLDDVMAVYRVGVGFYSTLDDLSFQKNMLLYQSCILSYLSYDEQKKILLKKQLNLINQHFKVNVNQLPTDDILLKRLSLKKLCGLGLKKIVSKFKKIGGAS